MGTDPAMPFLSAGSTENLWTPVCYTQLEMRPYDDAINTLKQCDLGRKQNPITNDGLRENKGGIVGFRTWSSLGRGDAGQVLHSSVTYLWSRGIFKYHKEYCEAMSQQYSMRWHLGVSIYKKIK